MEFDMEELGSVEQSLESRKDFELLFADLIGNDTSTSISEYGSSPHDQSDRIEPHSKVFTPEFTVHTSTPESGPEILNPLQSIETIPISPRDKNEIFSILELCSEVELESNTYYPEESNTHCQRFSSNSLPSKTYSIIQDLEVQKTLPFWGSFPIVQQRWWEAELLQIYFQRFHPTCPIINETQFMRQYFQTRNSDSLFKITDSLVFKAMAFIAFGFVKIEMLATSPYTRVHEGQSDLFNQARDAYHYGNENDQISLTQAAILLSNWGPNTFESETNRYWIDAAFEHAKAARIHKVRWGPQTKQQRVIWVCCLIRGRVVSYHSPIKHQRHLWRYKADLLCPEDFESDVQSSWYMDEKDNRKAVHAFLSLARLSDIIPLRRYHVVGANLSEKKSSLLASELLEISKIQEAICDWTQSQDQVLDSDNRTSQHALSIHFLYILKDALVIQLYSPYVGLNRNPDPTPPRFEDFALSEIERAAADIADNVYILLNGVEKEAIPIMLATWLPSAIAAMLLHVQTNNAPNVQNCQRLEDLLRILNLLKERFSGAEFVSGIAEALMQALPQKLIKGSSWKESTSFMAHIGRQPVNISDETKAGALNWALEFIAKCFIFKKI